MIIHDGKCYLSDSEKAELKQAVMLVPKECRLNIFTTIAIKKDEISENVYILFMNSQKSPVKEEQSDEICIVGNTAKAIRQILIHKEGATFTSMFNFVCKYYAELGQQLLDECYENES